MKVNCGPSSNQKLCPIFKNLLLQLTMKKLMIWIILQDEGIRYLSEGLRNSQTSEIFNELYYYYRNDQERRRY